MNDVLYAFKQFTALTHFPTDQLVPMRSLFPNIQACCIPKGTEIPPDLPVWPSAVPLVCSIGLSKENGITPIDGTVSLIAIHDVEIILEILEKGQDTELDEKTLKIIVNVLEAHRDLLSVLTSVLRPADLEEKELSSNEKLVKRIKGILKEPRDAAKLQAAAKDCKKISKYVDKSFRSNYSNGVANDLMKHIHALILDFQTLGVFLHLTGQADDFSYIEGNLNDLCTSIFSADLPSAQTYLQDFARSITDTETKLQFGVPLFYAIGYVYSHIKEDIKTLETAMNNCDAKLLVSLFTVEEPDNQFPVEFSDYIIQALKSLNNFIDPKMLEQVALSIYNKTQDPQLQYLCSSITYNTPKASGYLSILTTLIPFSNQQRKQHLDTFLTTAMNLFTGIHKRISEIAEPLINILPLPIQELTKKAIVKPESLDQCYKSVIAFKCFEKLAESYIADIDRFSVECENLDNICLSLFFAYASALKFSTIDLVQFVITFSEKHLNISKKTFASIQDAFANLKKFPQDAANFSDYDGLLNNVVRLTDLIQHVTKQIIASAPASLTEANDDIQKLSQLIKITFGHFEALQNALEPLQGIPISAARECARSCIQPMLIKLQNLMDTAATQPEFAQQIRSELRLHMFELQLMLSTLNIEGAEEAIKEIAALYRATEEAPDAPSIINASKELIQQLINFQQKLCSDNIDRDLIESIELSNVSVLCDALQKIQDPKLREITILFVKQSQTDRIVKRLFEEKPTYVRSLLVQRMKGVQTPDLDLIVQYSNHQLLTSNITIAASIPLLAIQSDFERLNVLIAQFLMSRGESEARVSINRMYSLLKQIVPLRGSIIDLTHLILSGKEISLEELAKLAAQYSIPLPETNATDDRTKAILQLAAFYAFIHQQKRPYSAEYLKETIEILTNSSFDTSDTVHNILASFLSAACLNSAFTTDMTRKVFDIVSDLVQYLSSNNTTDKRKLIDDISSLPTTFSPSGKLSNEFASIMALAIHEDSQSRNDIQEYINLLGLTDQDLETYLRTIYEYAEQEETPVLDKARLKESMRNVQRLMKKFLKAAKSLDAPIVQARFENFCTAIDDLKHTLSASKDPQALQIVSQVESSMSLITSVVNEIAKGDRSNVNKLIEVLNQILAALSQLTDSHLQSPLVEILALLAEDIQEIANTIDAFPSEEELQSAEPLKKITISESRTVAHFTRAYVIESKKYIDALMEQTPIVDPEIQKSFNRAVSELKESAQVLYLIVRLTDTDDQYMQNKIIFGCRRLLASSQLFISQVLMPGGPLESETKIKETFETSKSHLNNIIDFATQYGSNKKAEEENLEITLEMSIERLRLTAQVLKLRRALEIAQNNEKILSE